MDTQWMSKVQTAADTATWMVKLNAWWWLLTVAGLGVFGAAPATAAAATAVRRRSDGDLVRFRDVVRIYRQEFLGANLALTPALLVLGLLGWNLLYFSAGPRTYATPQLLTLIALVIFGTACCYLGPLYAYYELPRHRYITTAVRITLARPLWSVLMALVTAAIIFAGSRIMLLAPVIAVGLWVHTCSWLGIRFFAENESRRAAAQDAPPDRPERSDPFALPTEPLRMH